MCFSSTATCNPKDSGHQTPDVYWHWYPEVLPSRMPNSACPWSLHLFVHTEFPSYIFITLADTFCRTGPDLSLATRFYAFISTMQVARCQYRITFCLDNGFVDLTTTEHPIFPLGQQSSNSPKKTQYPPLGGPCQKQD